MPQISLSSQNIRTLILGADAPNFHKYASQLINLANQNAQGTRPKVVGQMSELMERFQGRNLSEWETWYEEQQPESIDLATQRIWSMVSRLKASIALITESMVRDWVRDLVITKTFIGLRFQRAILQEIARTKGATVRQATPSEEARGIDGWIGTTPVSIKPTSYRQQVSTKGEWLEGKLVYWEKTKNGIRAEYDF